MSKCVKCGSYAFNLYKEDIDQGGLCDVHYWQYRAHRAEALAEQPAPAPGYCKNCKDYTIDAPLAEQPAHQEPIWFWTHPTHGRLYKQPPAQRTWVGLTDVEWMNIVNKDQAWFGQRPDEVAHEVAKLVEAKLKEKNT